MSDYGRTNPGDTVPMPQEEHENLARSQQNALMARSRILQAADNGISSLIAATPVWRRILEPHHSLSKSLHERYPLDEFAKSCYDQAEVWMKE